MSEATEKSNSLADYSSDEIAALSDTEKSMGPANSLWEFQRTLSDEFQNGNEEDNAEYTYWVHATKQIPVQSDVAVPDFEISDIASERPIIRLKNLCDGLIPYIEVDSRETFDSPFVLRMPPLATVSSGYNLRSHKGSKFFLNYTTDRDYRYNKISRSLANIFFENKFK
jgi:hypothetical protein